MDVDVGVPDDLDDEVGDIEILSMPVSNGIEFLSEKLLVHA
jgi:hypothetical protein